MQAVSMMMTMIYENTLLVQSSFPPCNTYFKVYFDYTAEGCFYHLCSLFRKQLTINNRLN